MKPLKMALPICFLLGSGCATAPNATEQAAADYGTPIAQVDAEMKARTFLNTRLKDPMSAMVEFKAVEKGWREGAMGRPPTYGYLLDAQVNAKNSFGGYTGAQPYQFFFRDGNLVSTYAQTCLTPGSCYMAPVK